VIAPPDPRWLPVLKLLFGFLLLIELGALVVIIAIGKVEMQTSYGLGEIIGCLLTLSGGFAQWAFGSKKSGKEPDE
jgi:hypothetical protein